MALELAHNDCIQFSRQPYVRVVHALLKELLDHLPLGTRRDPLDRFDGVLGGRMHYARLPQQVLDGEGRETLALGVGMDSLPRGREVFTTDGLGSMCTGLVPPPKAIGHRLSVCKPWADAQGAASF